MSTQLYPRRPERPKSKLDGEDWNQRLTSLTSWIKEIIRDGSSDDSAKHLHVGAIWGPRGSGKTSLLETLLGHLGQHLIERLSLPARDPEPKKPERPPLFVPDLIDDANGDHLLAHILTFFQEHYKQLKDPACLNEAMQLLTAHSHSREFEAYEKDVAPSAEKLKEALVIRLSARSIFSKKLRESISKGIPPGLWYLVLIDDLDLVPHRGPQLLDIIHTYLRDLPIIVLLAADREQFVAHLGARLNARHLDGDRHLAYQILAKQIPYEWSVPQPSGLRRLDDLIPADDTGDRMGKTLQQAFGGASGQMTSGWHRREARLAQRRRVSRVQGDMPPPKEQGLGESIPPVWGKEPRKVLLQLLPHTWRGINRTHNRLATLIEELEESPKTTKERYQRQLGCIEPLIIPLLAGIVAVDEQIPELALWHALERGADLLPHLPRPPGSESSTASTGDAVATNQAPLDRLRPPWLKDRELEHARSVLMQLTEFWEVVQAASSTEGELISRTYAATELYAISVSPGSDARTALTERILAQLSELTKDAVKHIDLREAIAGERPTAKDLQKLLQDPPLHVPDTADVAIFARAPLSLMTWLGWKTRQHSHRITILGLHEGMISAYPTESAGRIDRSITEPRVFAPPFPVSFAYGAEVTRVSREAALIIDIRPEPDMNGRAPIFYRGDTVVVPEHAYKFVSNRGFTITPENVSTILGDVCWLLNEIKLTRDIQRFHIALATSNPAAFLIGRLLHPFAPVELYEYDPAGLAYRWVASLG